ncbi:hypothetical protein [Flavobacterium sp. 5]|uniref:hypothetical protein n=1 Tax=Flavobacterium sp. 5 TaxID=2035199 RepID=UPI000C2CCE44|nr:hypothetical protein [Flavobacterium sp. 5]PKB18258.1 AraC family transcriptional regulator [Flavobacterium sp. 5]
MKSIYLKAGKTQDVFNDLKDNFNGILTLCNDEFNLVVESYFARGNIKGITFPDGMTFLEFDMIFHDDVRLSMELLKTSPIFFAYCSQGTIQHSFGEQGERKSIKKQHTGILKSASSVNSILHFAKHTPTKFYVIEIGIDVVNSQNAELIKKLKNTFFQTKENYLDISYQSLKITQKIEELNMLIQKGNVGKLLKNQILEDIIELEIGKNTDVFTEVAQRINSFRLKQIDEIERVLNFVIDVTFELFTSDFIIQKARLFVNNMQKEFKLIFNRTVHHFLIYFRIERGRI